MSHLKIKLSEKLILKIDHNPDDSNYLYKDQFDEISLIVRENRNFSNQGPHKNDSYDSYFDYENEDSENLKFITEDDFIFYEIAINRDFLHLGQKLEHGFSIDSSDLIDGFIKFKKGTFGDNDQGLKSWFKSLNSIIQGEIYSYGLIELEKCNLGHIHETEIDGCSGFYGYENESALISDIILDFIDLNSITCFEDLSKHLSPNDMAKIKLKDVI